MFINVSNHASAQWGNAQREAAEVYGEIVDLPFPQIDPMCSSEDCDRLVQEYADKILEMDRRPVVMLQGEFIFTWRLVTRLKEHGVTVVAAQTTREAEETKSPDGSMVRRSVFRFVRFMEY